MRCKPSVTERIFNTIVLSTVVALLLRETFAAPIRAYIPGIWYAADALVLFSLAAFFFCRMLSNQSGEITIVITTIIFIGISFLLLAPKSAMFASRYLLVFCVGALAAHNELHKSTRAKYGLAIIILILSGSIIYERFFGFEWPETQFESALGTDSAVQRFWWRSDEEKRLPGFAIASTDAALLLACSVTMFLYPTKIWRFKVALLFGGIVIYALILTKQYASTITVGVLITTIGLLHLLGCTAIKINQIAKTLAIVGLILCQVIPFALSDINLAKHLGSAVSTINERTTEIWPRAIDRLFSGTTFIIGNGFGSVGRAAEHTSIKMIEVPDNAFLFLAIQIGAFAPILFLIAIYIVARGDVSRPENGPCFAIVALLSINGFTANIGLNVAACLFLGYCLAYLAVQTRAGVNSQYN